MSVLKVVCLISGGKDSLFSILHCLANGHEIVALANLHPPYNDSQAAVDDLDSYMYQTIGHSVIPLFEKALGLPLYRQDITGIAVNGDKSYGPSNSNQNDETEALIPLLRKVMTHHPEVNAVSTGAILSDYQRTRVESVAVRLGLIPLSYLWQYPFLEPCSQTSLLEHMAAVGQDSRILKVASGGLDTSFLWQNVADPRTISRLDKASRRFGSADDGAVLGEGGEYETLAVAGPSPLWKGRILIHEDQREIIDGEAGSASIRILKADVEMNECEAKNISSIPTPPLLEPGFQTILDDLQASKLGELLSLSDTVGNPGKLLVNTLRDGTDSRSVLDSHTLLPSVTGEGSSASAQMNSIMDRAQSSLQGLGSSFRDVVYTSIVLRDMAEFPAINTVYGSYFGYANPPARATIACANVLPSGKDMMVSFTLADPASRRSRKGLHVQSRSYWAPANIGPYSQAISIPEESNATDEKCELVYIAGQIPLKPASMELPRSGINVEADTYLLQSVLALQHAVRVGRAVEVRQWTCAIAFIVADSSETATIRGKVARQVWNDFHRSRAPKSLNDQDDEVEDDDFDVWDVKYGPNSHHTSFRSAFSNQTSQDLAPSQKTPPLHVLRVDALPRSATIEWVTYGTTSGRSNSYRIPHFDHLLEVFKGNIVLAP